MGTLYVEMGFDIVLGMLADVSICLVEESEENMGRKIGLWISGNFSFDAFI